MVNVLVWVLSFLGLLAGVVVSYFTKEELKPGKRYFLILEKALLLAVGFSIIFYVSDFFSFLALGFLAGIVFRKHYFYFGLALPLVSGQVLVLLSSLAFIFGLPYGTLLASRVKDKRGVEKEIIFSGLLFFAATLVSYFSGYHPLLMFASGALIVSSFGLRKFWIFPIA